MRPIQRTWVSQLSSSTIYNRKKNQKKRRKNKLSNNEKKNKIKNRKNKNSLNLNKKLELRSSSMMSLPNLKLYKNLKMSLTPEFLQKLQQKSMVLTNQRKKRLMNKPKFWLLYKSRELQWTKLSLKNFRKECEKPKFSHFFIFKNKNLIF